jgi:ferric-dicitrate binding protein FerR (iron transport regulator)
LWYNGQSRTSLDVITGNHSKSDTLPDGSGVYLNKATQLSYNFDKKKNAHLVKLKGEAYFNIHHNNEEKFIVDAGGVFIKDIGTSFNVKAYPDSNLVEVVVEEGEVMFFTDTDSGLYLKKDGRGIYDKKTKQFTIAAPDPNITAYKTRFFSFTDADLGSVVNTLNQIYSTRLVIGNSLKSCRITVNFQNEDIEEIAGILAETLDLSVSQSNGQILLEGPGCSVQ